MRDNSLLKRYNDIVEEERQKKKAGCECRAIVRICRESEEYGRKFERDVRDMMVKDHLYYTKEEVRTLIADERRKGAAMVRIVEQFKARFSKVFVYDPQNDYVREVIKPARSKEYELYVKDFRKNHPTQLHVSARAMKKILNKYYETHIGKPKKEKPPRCKNCGWGRKMHYGELASYTFRQTGCQNYEPRKR